MKFRTGVFCFLFLYFSQIPLFYALDSGASWKGSRHNPGGRAVATATVGLHCASSGRMEKASVGSDGNFKFSNLPAGSYQVSVQLPQELLTLPDKLNIKPSSSSESWIELSGTVLIFHPGRAPAAPESSGGDIAPDPVLLEVVLLIHPPLRQKRSALSSAASQ